MKSLILGIAAILYFVSTSASAVVLIVENGELLGADNVEVNGDLYSVRFQDGTCYDIFDGCDSNSDFLFNDISIAAIASEALLDQVFVDGSEGSFDKDPELTVGCEYIVDCVFLTPVELLPFDTVLAVPTTNYLDDFDSVGASGSFASTTEDYTNYFRVTWAVWDRMPIIVPEPDAIALLGIGLFGLYVGRLRYRREVKS